MFGLAETTCPKGFEQVGVERFPEAETILLHHGLARVVPEVFLLRRQRCLVAAARSESPPALIVEPIAPKITIGLHGRPVSIAVRSFLDEISEGVGFMVSPDLEPMVAACGRQPAMLHMRVLSGDRIRPGISSRVEGHRVLLGPEHIDALAAAPRDGLGFLECYESLDRFLAEPMPGVASMIGDSIVSMAVVYARAERMHEVAVYTRPEARRRGHAMAASFHCLQEIVRQGGVPVWTAVDEASRRLAIRLGLVPVGEKVYVEFTRPPRG